MSIYTDLVNEFATKIMDTIKHKNTVSHELYASILFEFIEAAQKVGKKPRQEYNPRA